MEAGEGDPIVFVHGNPEAPYIWRNIMPHLEKYGRVALPRLHVVDFVPLYSDKL